MGSFLISIKEEESHFSVGQQKWKQPLEKIKQYHGMFKSVCETFIIFKDQFTQIFGSADKMAMWDQQNIGKVDALELFTGLAMFSTESSFKDKLKFIFTIFDFNEIKSISFVELEYIVLCICNFIYKILGKSVKMNQSQVMRFLGKCFPTQQRITITKIYYFCLQSEEFDQFITITKICNNDLTLRSRVGEHCGNPEQMEKKLHHLSNQTSIHEQYEWYKGISEKIVNFSSQNSRTYGCKIGWIYGIHTKEIVRPFIITSTKEILYASSSSLILYSITMNSQRLYLRHEKKVATFCYNPKNNLVASAEIGQSPVIHIWDTTSLANLSIINTFHTVGIQLLEFVSQNLLITVGKRYNTPVVIYDIHNLTIQYSFFLQGTVQTILNPLKNNFGIKSNHQKIFILLSKTGLHFIQLGQQLLINSKEYQYTSSDWIVCGCVTFISIKNPYLRALQKQEEGDYVILTGHNNGQLRMTIPNGKNQQSTQILKLGSRINMIEVKQDVIIVCVGSQIVIYEIEVVVKQSQQVRVINLLKIPDLKLLDNEISYFDVCEQFLLLITSGGDFVKLTAPEITYKNSNYFQEESLKRIDTIISFQGEMKGLCIVERTEDQYILFCITHQKKILGINHQTHQLEDAWEVHSEEKVNAIDAVYSDEGYSYIACGCSSGKLYVRIDWQQNPKFYECSGEITQVKLSRDCSYLLVATSNNYLLFFSHSNRNFSSPRKLHFENQAPIGINFLDNYKFFLVNTSFKNVYLVEIPQLKHKNIHKENQKINVSQLQVKYAYNTNNPNDYTIALLGGQMKMNLITLANGHILYYESPSSFLDNSYIILKLHQGIISKLLVAPNHRKFYSLGKYDQTLVQWNVAFSNIPSNFINQISSNNSQPPMVLQQGIDPLEVSSSHTYLFRGTKEQKINENLLQQFEKRGLNNNQAMQQREPSVSLKTKSVYGLNCHMKNNVQYIKQGKCILYYCSRFVIEMNIETKEQRIIEKTDGKVSCLAIQNGKIFLSVETKNPKIYILPKKQIKTTHLKGILHVTVKGDYIVSYAKRDKGYSINLHDCRTGKLIAQRVTNIKIDKFILINQELMVSIRQIRIWKDLNPSECLGHASAGVQLPNGHDIMLGNFSGELFIFNKNGILKISETAHDKQIIEIKVNQKKDDFEIITLSKDEKIKIWNSKISCILMINLRENPDIKFYNDEDKEIQRNYFINVSSIDVFQNRILLCYSSGFLCELEINKVKVAISNKPKKIGSGNGSSFNVSSGDNLSSQDLDVKLVTQYRKKWTKIIEFHNCTDTGKKQQNDCIFCVNPMHPLMASTGKGFTLIVRQLQRDNVVGRYSFEPANIVSLKFSQNGELLILGMDNFEIKIYKFVINFGQDNIIKKFILIYSQHFKDNIAEIVNIQFSPCSNYFAVSYLPRSRINPQATLQQDFKSTILIYKSRNNRVNQGQDKYYILNNTILNSEDSRNYSKYVKSVYFMTFIKTQATDYLHINQQYFDQNKIRLNFYKKTKHILYNIETGVIQYDPYAVNWLEINIPNLFNIFRKNEKPENENQNEAILGQLAITAMKILGNTIIYGDTQGKIHLVRLNSLYVDKSMACYQYNQKCLGKLYSSHTSFINQIEISYNSKYLLVSGLRDESIVKYQIVNDYEFDLDNTQYNIDAPDLHHEYLTKDNLYNYINNIQPIRQEVKEILSDVQNVTESNYQMSPIKIFGRRAYDRRNNMFHDQLMSLIYCLGPNIIIQDTTNTLKQSYIPASPNPKSHNPRISCLDMKLPFLVVATEDQISSVYIWDINSKSCIGEMNVECSIIHQIKLLGDQYLAIYGVNEHNEALMQLLNWKEKRLIGEKSLMFSAKFLIKDLCKYVIKGDDMQFVSCGVQHLSFWQMRGQTFVSSSFLGKVQGVTFMTIVAQNQFIFSGCESGEIWIWKHLKFHKKYDVNKVTIRSIWLHDNILISGGMDSNIIVCEFKDEELLVNRKICLNPDKKLNQSNEYSTSYDIQSLVGGINNNLYIGTRSGDIYELNLSGKEQFKQIIYSHSNETIVSVVFGNKNHNDQFYSLTQSGLIEIWSLKTLQRLRYYRISKKCKKIFSLGDNILICCDRSLMCLKFDASFTDNVKELSVQFDAFITDCIMSKDQTSIAVSLNHNESNMIIIYDITHQLEEKFKIINLRYEIQYLDFSTDKKFVLFKDKFEQLGMIDLINLKRINTIFVQMQVQWESEGIRISPKGQKIYTSYNRQNKIIKIRRLNEDHILVGDEMGTLRIFQYPSPQNRIGQLHVKCYSVHMNFINSIQLHPSLPYILTTAIYDNSMILWKVTSQ